MSSSIAIFTLGRWSKKDFCSRHRRCFLERISAVASTGGNHWTGNLFVALFPSILSKDKPALQTNLMTAAVALSIAVVYVALAIPFAAVSLLDALDVAPLQ